MLTLKISALRRQIPLLFLLALLGLNPMPQALAAPVATNTGISGTPNPSTQGASVTITATVTVASTGAAIVAPLAPASTVTFYVDGVQQGLPVAVATGGSTATFSTTSLASGTRNVTATFNDSTGLLYNSSNGSYNQIVKANPAVAVATSGTPSTYGQAVTFTAALSGGFGTPTGTIQFKDSGNPLGPPVNVDNTGQATFTTGALPANAAPHAITAVYSGDGFNTGATGTLVGGQMVNPATPTVSVASSSAGAPPTSTFGESVTFAATVTGVVGGAAPTGSVQFKVDGTPQGGPVSLDAIGQATLTLSTLSAPASHVITADYSGDPNYNTATGTLAGGQQVNAEPTATSVTSSINPSGFGQAVVFTVTVTGGNGVTPTGGVTLMNGATLLGSPTLNANGQAQLTVSNLPVGANTISAAYAAQSNFGASSGTVPQTVNATTNPILLTSAPNPSTFNANVTFTVTIQTSGGVNPTGTVTFFSDGSMIGSSTLSGGSTTFFTASLTVGTHSITASYGGDGNYNPGTSGQLAQIVNRTAPGVTVDNTTAPNGPSSTVLGQAVTFGATVTGTGGVTPTGTASFTATPVDSLGVPTGAPAITVGSSVLDASGVTHLTASSLPVGRYAIRAVYSGDATYNGGTSAAPVTQIVTTAATSTVTLNAATSLSGPTTTSSEFGQTVVFRATVAYNGGGFLPTNVVTFYDGGTLSGTTVTGGSVIGTATLGAGGAPVDTAALSFSGLSGGTHTINAVYNGDSHYGAGGAGITFTVNKATPTVVVGSTATGTPPTAPFGQSVTFTATVTGVGGAAPPPNTPPTTVTFLDGANPIGSATLGANGNPAGVATISVSLPGGPHNITASFPGDSNYTAQASSAYPFTVQKAAPIQTTLIPSSNSPNLGDPVTFTVMVQGQTGATPTGSVAFTDTFNNVVTPLDTVSLTPGANATGSAATTTNALPAGPHTITAVYSGDQNYQGVQKTLALTVNASGTSLTVASSTPPPADQPNGLPTSVFGQPVTFTARITSAKGVTPTGNITFTDTNGQPLGAPAALTPAGPPGVAIAALTTATLSVSPHAISASYPGDASNIASTGTVPQQVGKAATKTALTSKPNPSSGIQAVTFTAVVTVNAPGAGTPTGNVTFQQVGAAQPVGSAPVVRQQDGGLTATFTTSALPVSISPPFSVTATYVGDGNFTGSTSPVINQTVFDVAPTITGFNPSYLLVPGTARDANHAPLGPADKQALVIQGQNIRADATIFINGDRLAPVPGSVAPDGSKLTVLVPPADVAISGAARILVQNANQVQVDPNAPNAPVSFIPINPVMVLPNFPVPGRPDKLLRMFSVPFDYSTVSPYNVLAGVMLTPPLDANGYNPDVNILSDFTFGLSGATTPLYHWDPQVQLYQTTRANADPSLGLQPADLHLLLGQAYWIVGGQETQQLGIMQLGIPSGFNPTGLALLPGWNMIGNPFPRDIPLNSLRVLTQGGVTLTFSDAVSAGLVSPILWSWDGTQYAANFDGAPGANSLLRQYDGYWFYSYQPITLLVTLPQQ